MTKGHETCLMTHLPQSGTKRGPPPQQQHREGVGARDSRGMGGGSRLARPGGRLHVSPSCQDSDLCIWLQLTTLVMFEASGSRKEIKLNCCKTENFHL